MRSVWFVLFDPTLEEVEACLGGAGFVHLRPFEHIQPRGQWNYPPGSGVVLFAHCAQYDPAEDPDEHQEILRCAGGRVPTVNIHIDVSGRSPGDIEVRYAAETVLSRFDGLAFDDYTSPEHGWTLAEIRNGTTFEGLRFFDYAGYHARSRKG